MCFVSCISIEFNLIVPERSRWTDQSDTFDQILESDILSLEFDPLNLR